MGHLDDLLGFIHEYEKKYNISEDSSEAEKLRFRITHGDKTKDEWMAVRQEVRDFMESGASEEDKKMVQGYTEMLSMLCSAIEKK